MTSHPSPRAPHPPVRVTPNTGSGASASRPDIDYLPSPRRIPVPRGCLTFSNPRTTPDSPNGVGHLFPPLARYISARSPNKTPFPSSLYGSTIPVLFFRGGVVSLCPPSNSTHSVANKKFDACTATTTGDRVPPTLVQTTLNLRRFFFAFIY